MVLKLENVHECGEDPCSTVECQNGGTCKTITSDKFECECGSSFSGTFCETPIDPCVSNPCQFGSTCEPINSNMFVCKCPFGRRGKLCEFENSPAWSASTPEFDGSSSIQFPCLEKIGKTFEIEVFFLTKATDGLILYDGQFKNGRGDFISINLVRSHVQFRFNLGSGVANIT